MKDIKEKEEIKKCCKESDHNHECNCNHEDTNCECNHDDNREDHNHDCECDHNHETNEDCGEDCECEGEHTEVEDYINQLEDKIVELDTLILKEKAELVNYRKRKDEEVLKMLKYSNEDLAKEILPTIDNFERAINLDDTNLEDELSKFLSGFKMIYTHLKTTLEKYDIKAIDGINKPFDPIYHQAVSTVKVDGKETNTVVEVLQKGYLLKDKVIRPAMVKVAE